MLYIIYRLICDHEFQEIVTKSSFAVYSYSCTATKRCRELCCRVMHSRNRGSITSPRTHVQSPDVQTPQPVTHSGWSTYEVSHRCVRPSKFEHTNIPYFCATHTLFKYRYRTTVQHTGTVHCASGTMRYSIL
jgi:hypothetical protein